VTYFSVNSIKTALLVWFDSARVNIHLESWNLCKVLAYQKCVTCISGPVTCQKEIPTWVSLHISVSSACQCSLIMESALFINSKEVHKYL
jgi:hypothetical protein